MTDNGTMEIQPGSHVYKLTPVYVPQSPPMDTLVELDPEYAGSVGPEAPQTEPPKNLEGLRDELFETGSAFMPTRREQIVGIDNILGEIEEIIHWLRHSKEYGEYESRLQPGVVFVGSPGTGKTLVSRWIATQSQATFVNVRDFVHQGALFTDRDIQDLFARARASYARTSRPVVLFWDEFENSAVERSEQSATAEMRSVVSQLTAELDGIHGKNEGILLIGCTNYAHVIDEALLRRGRMGIQIEFHPPDRAGKEKILRYYLKTMNTNRDLDINTLSYFFPNRDTAADIEEACVEAWRHAVRRKIDTAGDEPYLDNHDLIKVFIKQLVGPPTTFVIPEEERMPIAIHESGHAIAALAYGLPMRLITVQPGKKSLGRVMVDEIKEYTGNIPDNLKYMRMLVGGLAAERAAGLPKMVGSSNDLMKVMQKAQEMVDYLDAGERTGVFNICALERQVNYSNLIPQVSSEALVDSDCDIKEIVIQVEKDACETLAKVGQDNLLTIAAKVNDRVTLTGNEFSELFSEVCGFQAEHLLDQ